MIPDQVVFRFYERKNSARESGKEWILTAQFCGFPYWILAKWDKKPQQYILLIQ